MTQPTELEAILQDFIAEARENLEQLELSLLELESDPARVSALSAIFRAVHSIKGSSSFFSLSRVEAVAHAGETLLDQVRDGRLQMSRELSSAMLQVVDVIRVLLSEVETHGVEGNLDVAPLVLNLERLAQTKGTEPSIEELENPELGPGAMSVDSTLVGVGRDSKIRVETGLLEKLMNLVGELVLARNQVVQHATAQHTQSLNAATQRLSVVTSELQEVVMKTRMQPIGHVFSRFPRVARDIAQAFGKRVRIELEGRETELDKTLLEAIQDPLTHLVRNAIGHGIESASERARLGKTPEGIVRLRAYHEAGMVNIEVSDDGSGLDLDAIRKTAQARGFATKEALGRMSDRELLNLVFVPGFSTQDAVTSVAGRGVGMDVVKTNIESIGGSVDIHSERFVGTTLKIKIPLTLAIIPALIVSCAGERYAIPQASLREVVRLMHDDPQHKTEQLQGAPVLRLRGKLLPLLNLAEELCAQSDCATRDSVGIVVIEANSRAFGLVVDEINDTEEIVVKPLWKRLRGLSCYAGATVMGDGRVALILEPLALAQRIGVGLEELRAPAKAERRPDDAAKVRDLTEQVLLCRTGQGERVAIPLSKVARLEHLPLHTIERTGAVEVARYRSEILPLVRVAEQLQERRKTPRNIERERTTIGKLETALPVVVYSHKERSVGLVVDAILDVVDVRVSLQRKGARKGVLGSMIVQNQVTEFLDVDGMIREAEPSFFAHAQGA